MPKFKIKSLDRVIVADLSFIEETYDEGDWELVDSKDKQVDRDERKFRCLVNLERTKRIERGVDISLEGYGSVALQGREEDKTTLIGLSMKAQYLISIGDLATKIPFMDRDNVLHELTPFQLIELQDKGAAWVSQIYSSSWVLKEMFPYAGDIEADENWRTS